MLHEEYNLSEEDSEKLLYDIRHPSIEVAERRKKIYQNYLTNVDIEEDGESEVVDFKDLDLSYFDLAFPNW